MKSDVPAPVLFECIDGFGLVTLNRPQALNAIDLQSVGLISRQLTAWAGDDAVKAVFFRGSGGRAFCAGGDVRTLYRQACEHSPEVWAFFDQEYALDAQVHRYPKPTIALMDGVVMGGGMGIAQGCSLRIATERTRMAMPETAIGLFPDVGASYFLSRLSPGLANYIGVVGESISGRDALQCGLADRLMPAALAADLHQVLDCVSNNQWPDEVPPSVVADVFNPETMAAMEQVFSAQDVVEILARLLKARDSVSALWVDRVLVQMNRNSPLMMCVTLEQLRRGRGLELEACLQMERGLMQKCFTPGCGDALEGIRALLVDKDKNPRWRFDGVDAVSAEDVAAFFADCE